MSTNPMNDMMVRISDTIFLCKELAASVEEYMKIYPKPDSDDGYQHAQRIQAMCHHAVNKLNSLTRRDGSER